MGSAGDARRHQKPVVPKITNNEDLANIAEAFVGAYFSSEGSIFSAWRFLLWLQQEDSEQDIPEAWEKAVLGHRFRGRTPSYLEIQEIVDGGEKILRVHYAEPDQPPWIEYRRSGPNRKFQEEPREVGAEKWEPLVFAQTHMTLVSTHNSKIPNERCPVPTKVNSWLLGAPTAPLVTVKP